MKRNVCFALVVGFVSCAGAASTIDASNRYSYGGNVGWVDSVADTNSGAVIGEYTCSGFVYSANVGWINLGSGSPANQIQYQNNSATDFGVNQDGLGNLRGYAYGANIGWINFEDTGTPKVDLLTGKFTGYVYSANCGWISLSNSVAFVQTDSIRQGALAPNNLTISWLLQYFGTTNVVANADPDHDGLSNVQEYQAGTSPTDSNDRLEITSKAFANGGTNVVLTWKSVPTRFYNVQKTVSLTSPVWLDSGLGLVSPGDVLTTKSFTDTGAPIRFYRIEASRPLMP